MIDAINVVGLGYIGLPTALLFAAQGIKVVGTDCNKKLISDLQDGIITFKENGLSELFGGALRSDIKFVTEYHIAEAYIVAVPTPYDKASKKIDTQYIISALKSITEVCPRGAVIIIESTVSPGTIYKTVYPFIESYGFEIGKDIHIVHAPERIIPGNMLYELANNSRTIGADSREIGEKVKELYSSFCNGEIIITDIRTAEMTKVVENTYRDINIAFANELAKICRSDGMDVYEIISIANKHPRVNIMQPGPGVGGHCISVDPWFLVGDYPGLSNIILAARKINDSMPGYVLSRLYDIMKEQNMTDITKVGLYGLTYKENVDDIRESPALQLLEMQRRHLANELKVYDPLVKTQITDNQYFDIDSFLNDIELVVIMAAHDDIKMNIDKFKNKIIFDTKNIFDCGHFGYSVNIYKL